LRGDFQRWEGFLDQIEKLRLPAGFGTALAACAENHVYGNDVPLGIRDLIKRFRAKEFETKAATQA
jgi:hypothetical protein